MFIILIWIYFSIYIIYGRLPSKVKEWFILSRVPLLVKHLLLDDNFYRVMLICQEKVPPGETILFESCNRDISVYSKEWYRDEYFIQKAPYWLYPRRVIRATDIENAEGVDFRLVFDERNAGFKLYHKDKLVYANF